MDIETMWYEGSPYLYAVVGVVSLFGGSVLALVSGGLLITASLTIMRMRWVHRKYVDGKGKAAR